MKKKILLIALLAIFLVPLVGCKKAEDKRSDAVKFKEEYESLNKQAKEDGSLYRTISVDEENPIIYTTYEELESKITEGENFLVYFGNSKNEYCRTVVPYLIQQAKTQGIDKIYYVDTTPPEEAEEGTKAIGIEDQYYQNILKRVQENNLDSSTLAVFIRGELAGKTSGVSSSQSDASQELTGSMKEEMLAKFKELYITYNSNRG